MRKHHIRFNQAQLRTEVVPFTVRDYVRWILGRGLLFAGVALAAILVFDRYFESPKVRSQQRQIAFLESQLDEMEVDDPALEVDAVRALPLPPPPPPPPPIGESVADIMAPSEPVAVIGAR